MWYVLALPISVFLAGVDWERKSKEEGRGRRVKERGSGGNGKERKEKERSRGKAAADQLNVERTSVL